MKQTIYILLLLLTSCRYQWVATESKISTVKDRIVITPTGKPRPIGDTTVTGIIISKKRVR